MCGSILNGDNSSNRQDKETFMGQKPWMVMGKYLIFPHGRAPSAWVTQHNCMILTDSYGGKKQLSTPAYCFIFMAICMRMFIQDYSNNETKHQAKRQKWHKWLNTSFTPWQHLTCTTVLHLRWGNNISKFTNIYLVGIIQVKTAFIYYP